MTRNTTATTLIVVTLLAGLGLVGCGSLKPSHAPFHVFTTSLLNGEHNPGYPREPVSRPIPNQPIAYVDPGADDLDGPKETLVASAADSTDGPPARANRPKAKPRRDEVRTVAESTAERVRPMDIRYTPGEAAGYIGAICKLNGVSVDVASSDNAIAELYSTVKKRGRIYHATRPAVGDIVFFHNTYDRNDDGRNNDWYTHVGVVEGVDDDGTIHFLSYFEGRVQQSVINLEHPQFAANEASGKVWNSTLRRKHKDDPPFTQYGGGQLFAGFGNLLGNRKEFIVIDNWVPGMVVSGL